MNKPPVGMPGIGGSLGLCALCGQNFLFEIVTGKGVPSFEVSGCNQTLFAHKKCIGEHDGKDWMDLPEESPLRKAFERSKTKVTEIP